MPKIAYGDPVDFKPATLTLIRTCQAICDDYAQQGYSLSLRQLYYQLVARGYIPNKQTEYKRLGDVIGNARLAGLIDWRHLEDRGRAIVEQNHWETPQSILNAVADQYRQDKWRGQPRRVFVMVEKAALEGVFEPVCRGLDVPLFACRGYPSLSSLWEIGYDRLRVAVANGQRPVILHFGDHDPSGIDMTRDLADRLSLFTGVDVKIERLALNRDQIDQYDPPPNPAKVTDSRYMSYVAVHGEESWELDALDPAILGDLATQAVLRYIESDAWAEAVAEEEDDRADLTKVASNWQRVVDALEDDDEEEE